MLLERDPDDLDAHHAQGLLLLAAGKEAEALRAFAEVLQRVERLGLLCRESSL
jgi:Flp pilus assembly protein TadD